jgi:hypothetical protein
MVIVMVFSTTLNNIREVSEISRYLQYLFFYHFSYLLFLFYVNYRMLNDQNLTSHLFYANCHCLNYAVLSFSTRSPFIENKLVLVMNIFGILDWVAQTSIKFKSQLNLKCKLISCTFQVS